MSISGMSTVASKVQGAAKVGSDEDEVSSRQDPLHHFSQLAALVGPAAQEEARQRAPRKAAVMNSLMEWIDEFPELANLVAKLQVIELVESAAMRNLACRIHSLSTAIACLVCREIPFPTQCLKA